MSRRTAFLYTDDFLSYNLGPQHPLQQRRLQMVQQLLEAYDVLSPKGPIDWLTPTAATEAELLQVHTADFVDAVHHAGNASETNAVGNSYLSRYGLGAGDTPAFPGMYEAAALYAGGTVNAARLVLSGKYDAAFNVAGGLHHAHPNRASGFCTFNDCALGVHAFLDSGMTRVAYIDIDAHHGDGTQDCFYTDPRVLTISLHQAGLFRFFPGTGWPEERGEGDAAGTSVNVPYYPFTEDEVWHEGFDAVVPDALRRFQPQAVVLQVGADAHVGDPLTRLLLTSEGWMRAFDKLLTLCEGLPLVITGGGGYNLRTVARLWSMVTARTAGIDLPNPIPTAYADAYGIPTLHDWEPQPKVEADLRETTRTFLQEQLDKLAAQAPVPTP